LSYDARIAVLGHELGHLMYTEYEDSPFLTIREIELRADLVGLLVGRLVSEFFSVQAFGELLAAVHNLPYDPLTEFYRTPPESRRIDYAHLDDEARIAFIRKADKLSE
jgi:hypothetical protein